MPPHTTYLRITPRSVLQLRIFTDHPLDAGQRWLIHPTDPALPKIIKAIKHLILPKLREENLRKFGGRAGGSTGVTGPGRGVRGKKRVKDVVTTDEFEVGLFLTELSTRHALLVKEKVFRNKNKKMTGNSTRMTDAMNEGSTQDDAVVIREESPSTSMMDQPLEEIPAHTTRRRTRGQALEKNGVKGTPEVILSDDESDGTGLEEDDKKKLNFKTSYEGFNIWGWTLVVLVKRKDTGRKKGAPVSSTSMMGLSETSSAKDEGQGLMEEWISTQAAGDTAYDLDDT